MAHQVIWTKAVLDEFIRIGGLTETEEIIMRTRAAGMSRVEQSMKLGMSLSSVDRAILRIKRKYDEASKWSPILPERRKNQKETYMTVI